MALAAGSRGAARTVARGGVHVCMEMYRRGHHGTLDAQPQQLAPATIWLRSLRDTGRVLIIIKVSFGLLCSTYAIARWARMLAQVCGSMYQQQPSLKSRSGCM